MHWSIHKHGNMAIWHSIEQFAAFCAIKCMTSGCFFSHLGTSGWVKLDYFPKGEKTENTRIDRFKSLETRIHLTMRSSKSISKMGALAEWIKPCLFFLLFIFPTTFFGLVDRRFLLRHCGKIHLVWSWKNIANGQWTQNKTFIPLIGHGCLDVCLYFLERLHSSSHPKSVYKKLQFSGKKTHFQSWHGRTNPLKYDEWIPKKVPGFKQSPFEKKVSKYGWPPWILQSRWMLMQKKITSIISVKVFRMRCQTRIQGD